MNMIFCDYDTGMLTFEPNDEIEGDPMLKQMIEMQKAAFHEAGHAVLSYALGHGLSGIALMTTVVERDSGKAIGYHGKMGSKWGMGRVSVSFPDPSQIIPFALTDGIIAAAGPASERKFCLLNSLPLNTAPAAVGDHESIGRLSKFVSSKRRKPAAFRRFVWRRAQLMLEDETIWNAVVELGGMLNFGYWPDETEVGEHRCIMAGDEAREILDSAGIVPVDASDCLVEVEAADDFYEDESQ